MLSNVKESKKWYENWIANKPAIQNIISDYTVLGRHIKDLIHLGAYDYILP